MFCMYEDLGLDSWHYTHTNLLWIFKFYWSHFFPILFFGGSHTHQCSGDHMRYWGSKLGQPHTGQVPYLLALSLCFWQTFATATFVSLFLSVIGPYPAVLRAPHGARDQPVSPAYNHVSSLLRYFSWFLSLKCLSWNKSSLSKYENPATLPDFSLLDKVPTIKGNLTLWTKWYLFYYQSGSTYL